MEDIDRLLKLNCVNGTKGVGVEVRDDLMDTCSAKSAEHFGVLRHPPLLGLEQIVTDLILDLLGKLPEIFLPGPRICPEPN